MSRNWTKYVIFRCASQVSAECDIEAEVIAAIGELPRTVKEARERARRAGWRNVKGVGLVCEVCYEEITHA